MVDAELRGISVRHTVFNDYDFSETVDHCRKKLKIRRKTAEIRNSELKIKHVRNLEFDVTFYRVHGAR